MNKTVEKGQVWFARLIGEDSMEQGLRPIVIFQNSLASKFSSLTTVIPITSRRKRTLPTHVRLSKQCGLIQDSIALAENIITISKNMLISYIGEISDLELQQIESAILIQLGIQSTQNSKVI